MRPHTDGRGMVRLMRSTASLNFSALMSATYPCALKPAGHLSEHGATPALSMVAALGTDCRNGM